MGRQIEKHLETTGGLQEEAFQSSNCQVSSCIFIDGVLSSPTARKPTDHLGSKRLLNRFDTLVCWALRKLIPRHLAQKPPPDRHIYY